MEPDSPTRDPPGESRSNRGSRRRDQGDNPSSSSRRHDLVGRHVFIGRTQQQQQQQQQFQSYPQYRHHYSADPYSDVGSHRYHHRTSNKGHSHRHGRQGAYQAAYQDGPLHKRLSQGKVTRYQPHEDCHTCGRCDTSTYKSQLDANAHRQDQNHHRYNDVQTGEEGYDYYDVIVPKSPYRSVSRST